MKNNLNAIVLFLNTFSAQKISYYRLALANLIQEKTITSGGVFPVHKLGRVRSALEDSGTAFGNASQKFSELIRLTNSAQNAAGQTFDLATTHQQRSDGNTTVHTYFGADDTCLHLPTSVWGCFLALPIVQSVAQPILDEANNDTVSHHFDGETVDFVGPGVNTGYVISCLGMAAFIEALRAAGRHAGLGVRFPILRRSTLKVAHASTLADTTTYVGVTIVFLTENVSPTKLYGNNELTSENDFFTAGSPGSPCIGIAARTYVSTTDSHARALRSMVYASYHCNIPTPPSPKFEFISEAHNTIPVKFLSAEDRPIIQTLGDVSIELICENLDQHSAEVRAPVPKIATNLRDYLNLDSLFFSGDGFILPPPPSNSSWQQRRRWAYYMYSALVAVKTHPRDTGKPLVIIVDDQVMPIMNSYLRLVSRGWSDD